MVQFYFSSLSTYSFTWGVYPHRVGDRSSDKQTDRQTDDESDILNSENLRPCSELGKKLAGIVLRSLHSLCYLNLRTVLLSGIVSFIRRLKLRGNQQPEVVRPKFKLQYVNIQTYIPNCCTPASFHSFKPNPLWSLELMVYSYPWKVQWQCYVPASTVNSESRNPQRNLNMVHEASLECSPDRQSDCASFFKKQNDTQVDHPPISPFLEQPVSCLGFSFICLSYSNYSSLKNQYIHVTPFGKHPLFPRVSWVDIFFAPMALAPEWVSRGIFSLVRLLPSFTKLAVLEGRAWLSALLSIVLACRWHSEWTVSPSGLSAFPSRHCSALGVLTYHHIHCVFSTKSAQTSGSTCLITPLTFYFPNFSWVWAAPQWYQPSPSPWTCDPLSYKAPSIVKVRLHLETQRPAPLTYGLTHCFGHMPGGATSLMNCTTNPCSESLASNLLFKHIYSHDIPNKESISLNVE